jgi:5-(carboxyamino)imidazole ribonucleotide synthase
MTIPPGSTIGILGGGQLGKMLAVAAAQLGYRCHVFAPEKDPPAVAVSGAFTRADYLDVDALRRFASACDVVTYEFENIATGALGAIADKLRPSLRSLEIGQERALEKQFIENNGGRVAPWMPISSSDDLAAAVAALGCPLVLKTRRYGYDGKGQAWISSADDAEAAWESIGREPAIAEQKVEFEAEFSVLLACGEGNRRSAFNLPRNTHHDGILRTSSVPAGDRIGGMTESAIQTASKLALALGHVGMFTVEFFATEKGAVVNEIAPRVHNSGHWTIEGAVTSQFEQHIRAICGLPLGDPRLVGAGVEMENLIGEEVNAWPQLVAEPGAHVHLYGKHEPRPGRKMGHVTRVTL